MPVSTLFAQADPASGSLSVADIAVIVIYTVGIVILGCWAGLRKRGGGRQRNIFWPVARFAGR